LILLLYKKYFGFFELFKFFYIFAKHFSISIIMSKFILLFVFCAFPLVLVSQPKKIALIIAVGEYNPNFGLSPISSKNDIQLVKSGLIKMGFIDSEILQIVDKQADKTGVFNAFNKILEVVHEGDIVFVHYSGHGQQISDNNNDESDGFDESLVLYNAHSKFSDKYNGENHLRDDELEKIFNDLRLKLGATGQLIVTLDCCHSGTASRGDHLSRGINTPFVLPNTIAVNGTEDTEKGFGITIGSKNLAKFVILSGATAEQLNSETIDEEGTACGSLSYALCKSLMSIEKGDSFRKLFALITKQMAENVPNQNPQIEGEIDVSIFNTAFVNQAPYYEILAAKDDNTFTIVGGLMSGISLGDSIALYEAGTVSRKNGKSLVAGTVVFVDNFTAEIKLNKEFEIKNIKSFWVFVSAKNYSDIMLNVKLKIQNSTLLKNCRDTLNQMGFIKLNDIQPDLLLEQNGNFLNITSTVDTISVVRMNTTSPKFWINFNTFFTNFSQSFYLKKVEMEDPDFKVEVELLNAVKQGSKYVLVNDSSINEYPVFEEGEFALMRVKNTGNRAAFFNIIDIQPDGQINAVVPPKNISAANYKLDAGKQMILNREVVSFASPYGKETFIVFASQDPLDLTPIISTRGMHSRGVSPLELLLKDSFKTIGKRGTVIVDAQSTGSAYKYVFEIRQKNTK